MIRDAVLINNANMLYQLLYIILVFKVFLKRQNVGEVLGSVGCG